MCLVVERKMTLRRIVVAVRIRPVRRLWLMHILTLRAIFATRVADRWLCRTLCRYRTQIFAPTVHFAAPVAVPVEMTMVLSVRSRYPYVCAAADEHDIAVSGSRDVYIVEFWDHLFYHSRPRDNELARRGRRANDHGASCGFSTVGLEAAQI